ARYRRPFASKVPSIVWPAAITYLGTRGPVPEPANRTKTPERAPIVPIRATRAPSEDHARIRSTARSCSPSPTVTGPPTPFQPSIVPASREAPLEVLGEASGRRRNAAGGAAE